MIHPDATDDVVETASLYVLGALPDAERTAFERHLAEGCRTCEHEVATLAAVAGDLGRATPPRPPRPEARARLLARLGRPWTIVRASEGRWRSTSHGFDVRRLHRDTASGRYTSLLRVPAGARVPAHRHAVREELFLLAGDLTIDGERLGGGDYCAAGAGTIHYATASEAGCTFVLLASERDEVLDDAGARTGPDPRVTFVRAAAGGWRPVVAPGIEMRPLFADRAGGTVSGVVRMAPGARLPAGRRLGAEQLYVLAGDARLGDETLETGDYCRATAATARDVTHTESGCELLLVSSSADLLTY